MDVETLNSTINNFNIMDIYRTPKRMTIQYIFFSRTHRIPTKLTIISSQRKAQQMAKILHHTDNAVSAKCTKIRNQ